MNWTSGSADHYGFHQRNSEYQICFWELPEWLVFPEAKMWGEQCTGSQCIWVVNKLQMMYILHLGQQGGLGQVLLHAESASSQDRICLLEGVSLYTPG